MFTFFRTILLCFYFSICFYKTHGANLGQTNRADSILFKQHVCYVLKEHNALLKCFKKAQKITQKDSLKQISYEHLEKKYRKESSSFIYLKTTNWHTSLQQAYQESETHKGIIENTYRQLHSLSNKQAKDTKGLNLTERKALQKCTYYAKNKYAYNKKYGVADLMNGLHDRNVKLLQKQLQYTSLVTRYNPSDFNLPSLNGLKTPTAQLPGNLQSNQQVNKVFQIKSNTKNGEISPKQRFDKAVNNPIKFEIDSAILKKDTLLFKVNPYKLMPIKDRVKIGGSNQINHINGIGKVLSYTANINYLLTPKVKPVLAIGFSHSFSTSKNNIQVTPLDYIVRAGVETKLYKVVALFVNLEHQTPIDSRNTERINNKADIVIGITNYTTKTNMFRFWLGVNVNELYKQQPNVLVFRIGL